MGLLEQPPGPSWDDAEEPLEGRVIAGRYKLVKPLARGGMGVVWVARHMQLDVPVAVKLMASMGSQERARFEREARGAARIRSAHVVHVYDFGVEGDTPYIVMELLEGEDLGERLKREGRFTLAAASDLLTQASRALRRTHEAGIVHRDLKPGNIFLARGDEGDVVKILDFGLLKLVSPAEGDEATRAGVILGTAQYMSPEQVKAMRDIDHRADLWSLAVILFRVVTGYYPFSGISMVDSITKILTGRIPAPSQFAPDLPPLIDRFFERAFARDRALRFQSAQSMAEAFAAVVARSGSAAELDRRSFELELELTAGDWQSVSEASIEQSHFAASTSGSDEKTTVVLRPIAAPHRAQAIEAAPRVALQPTPIESGGLRSMLARWRSRIQKVVLGGSGSRPSAPRSPSQS